jgi:hypothetical protein
MKSSKFSLNFDSLKSSEKLLKSPKALYSLIQKVPGVSIIKIG